MFVESLKNLALKKTDHWGNQFQIKYMSITMYYSKRHGEHSIDLTVVVELISLQKELSKHFITMSYS